MVSIESSHHRRWCGVPVFSRPMCRCAALKAQNFTTKSLKYDIPLGSFGGSRPPQFNKSFTWLCFKHGVNGTALEITGALALKNGGLGSVPTVTSLCLGWAQPVGPGHIKAPFHARRTRHPPKKLTPQKFSRFNAATADQGSQLQLGNRFPWQFW